MGINEAILEAKLGELEAIRPWGARVISKFENFIRTGDDYSLFQVNPLRYASERQVSSDEAIDLFLHASRLGIFQIAWNLLCPQCGDNVQSLRSLTLMGSGFDCKLCHLHFDSQLDDCVQVFFTVSPAVREIAYHHPGALAPWDYFKNYRLSREAKVPQGPYVQELFPALAKFLEEIKPGQSVTVQAEIDSGLVRLLEVYNSVDCQLEVAEDGAEGIQVTVTKDGLRTSASKIRPGRVEYSIRNQAAKGALVGLFVFPSDFVPTTLEFDPYLSGKQLLTTQTFRDLFRSEVIAGAEGISVRDITILFTDLKGSTELYSRAGDLRAFTLVGQHFQSLGKVVRNHHGAIVKTIGDAVMASFMNPTDAVRAALDMLMEIDQFNASNGAKEITLKIGLHKGASIVVTLNQVLDYFGQTVNIAARVQGLADGDQIFVTQEVFHAPGVKEALAGTNITPMLARLKGLQEKLRVFRIQRLASA